MADNKSGSKASITRRDFVGGTLIGSGAALLSAASPGSRAEKPSMAPTQDFPQMISAPLNDLDQSWTGPGGVGSYANANGNTHSVVNAAHTFRNKDFEAQVADAETTGEHFDLVVVGGGFAGISAAYTYLKTKPDARVLILDNHAMFGGGSAKRV